MTAIGWIQILLFCAIIVALVKPLGAYMTRVFNGERTFLSPVLRPVEAGLYWIGGVDERREQHWLTYGVGMLFFHAAGFALLYALMRLQGLLPFNPADQTAVPADLAFVTVLQLTLIMEIALVHKVNLKSDRARDEVFEVLGYSNGADTVNLAGRAGPKVIARVAEKMLTKRGLAQLGRIVPVLASPVVAYLNNRDLQRAGQAALRFYGTMRTLPTRRKTPAES